MAPSNQPLPYPRQICGPCITPVTGAARIIAHEPFALRSQGEYRVDRKEAAEFPFLTSCVNIILHPYRALVKLRDPKKFT